MQFLNQHTSKYQKRSKHFVCTRFPGSSMFCIGWQPDYIVWQGYYPRWWNSFNLSETLSGCSTPPSRGLSRHWKTIGPMDQEWCDIGCQYIISPMSIPLLEKHQKCIKKIWTTSHQWLRPCGDQVRPRGAPTVLPWRCIGYLTALLRRCRRSHCAATATPRCSCCAHVTTPSHGMETEETIRRPMEMSRSCFCALGDPTARITAFWLFHGRRVTTQLWCGMPLTYGSFS